MKKKKKGGLSRTRLRLCLFSSLCFLSLLLFFWAVPHQVPEPPPRPPPDLRVKLEVFAEPGTPRVTIWSCPNSFPNNAQTIAMVTWLRLTPQPEIIYFSDAPGVPDMVDQVGIRHLTNISTNVYGGPVMSELFDRIQEEARGDIIVYINPDVILTQKFMDVVLQLADKTNTTFLLTGPRAEVILNDRFFSLDYTWFKDFDSEYNKHDRKTTDAFLDYFAFTKGLFPPGTVPALSRGRSWETWMLSKVLHGPYPTINGDTVMQAYHLFDPPPANKTVSNEELHNAKVLELSGGSKGGTLYCTDYVLKTCEETKFCLQPNTAALKNEYCQHSNNEKLSDSVLAEFNG